MTTDPTSQHETDDAADWGALADAFRSAVVSREPGEGDGS